MSNQTTTDTAIALAAAAIDDHVALAAPLVEVEVILPVVIGEMELSLDDAIDRLAVIQNVERALKKETDPLRSVMKFCYPLRARPCAIPRGREIADRCHRHEPRTTGECRLMPCWSAIRSGK